MKVQSENDDRVDENPEIFYSFAQNHISNSSFTSLDDETSKPKTITAYNIELQIVNNIKENEQKISQNDYLDDQHHQIKMRIIDRDTVSKPNIVQKDIKAINITFLYMEYIIKNPDMKIWLLSNMLLDIFLRFTILILFGFYAINKNQELHPIYTKDITPFFIVFIQVPRLLHVLTTCKLMFMDKYQLHNRSYLPMSHVFRSNFIVEECPKQEDLKPINYKDSILTWKSILFIILPLEIQWITMLPLKNKENTQLTFIISSYILKSIEVMIFEPSLLILLSIQESKFNFHSRLLFGFVLLDIVKFIILNMCLIIFSNVGKRSKVKI